MAQVRVFFVTNRDYVPDNKLVRFGAHFNPDGVAALRFGRAQFQIGAAGDPKLVSSMVYPETKGTEGFTKVGSTGFLDDLRETMKTGRSDTLVYIHGFNVTFEEALIAGAKLGHRVQIGGNEKPLNIVVMSWPSDGKSTPLMSYYSDREDARASGAAVARAFLKLRDYIKLLDEEQECDRRIHLLAHSMGNYVLRNGMQALLAKDPQNIVRVFDQIILAAPDEDDDAFETDAKLRLLPRIGRQVTTYFNRRDKALLTSDKTKANPDRLGSDGPRMIDLIPKKVVLVDCRNVGRADGFVEHSYYLQSPAVVADISAVLRGDLDPDLVTNRDYIAVDRVFRLAKELQPV